MRELCILPTEPQHKIHYEHSVPFFLLLFFGIISQSFHFTFFFACKENKSVMSVTDSTVLRDFDKKHLVSCRATGYLYILFFSAGLAAGLSMGALAEVTKRSLGLKEEGL